MRLLAMLLGTLAIAAAGCGEDQGNEPSGAGQQSREERPAPPTEPIAAAEDQPPADAHGGGFSGRDAENFNIAKTVCGSFPPRKVASDLGLHGQRRHGR